MKHCSLFLAVSALAASVGCSGASSSTIAPVAGLDWVGSRHEAATKIPSAKRSGSTLYVYDSGPTGNSDYAVAVYSNGGAQLLRTIDLGRFGSGFTVDAMGNLYVGHSSASGSNNALDIYADRGTKVLRTLHQRFQFKYLTVDSARNLYTLCAVARVCEYADARQHIVRKISIKDLGGIEALAIDASGDLAVAVDSQVQVFATGATQPYWQFKRTSHYNLSTVLMFDATGDLYLAAGSNGVAGSVSIYAPDATTPMTVITNGIYDPTSLAIDSSENLYVLNACDNNASGCKPAAAVTVYPPGSTVPTRTITKGVSGLGGVALDAKQNLYVANDSTSPSDTGTVTVYAPNAKTPKRTITKGINHPKNLAVDP